VDSQNNLILTTENPYIFQEMALHSQNIDVWCMMSCFTTVGPLLFKETVNARAYKSIIMQLVLLLTETSQKRTLD
jgi:hypothetical protein